jgi:oligopeptide/dipeptide ABC transporter ATP-binding protein
VLLAKNRDYRPDPIPLQCLVQAVLTTGYYYTYVTSASNSGTGCVHLEGVVPSPINSPSGCRFHPRCFRKIGAICEEEEPPFIEIAPDHQVACHLFS